MVDQKDQEVLVLLKDQVLMVVQVVVDQDKVSLEQVDQVILLQLVHLKEQMVELIIQVALVMEVAVAVVQLQ